jgi:hypothetical protein
MIVPASRVAKNTTSLAISTEEAGSGIDPMLSGSPMMHSVGGGGDTALVPWVWPPSAKVTAEIEITTKLVASSRASLFIRVPSFGGDR